MGIRTVIAALLGLVIQLAQVAPCASAARASSCVPVAMSCCAGECPCISNDDQPSKPAPAVAATFAKLVLAAAPDVTPHAALHPQPRDEVAGPAPGTRAPAGYAGVPLAVAFCSFVI